MTNNLLSLSPRLTAFGRFARRHLPAAIALTAAGLATASAAPVVYTDEEEDDSGFTLIEEGTRPLATVTFSSADRFLDEGRYIFDAAGSPEAFEVVEAWLADTLNNLEGFDRDQPFGIMFYLAVAFPPVPEFVAYVPVESIEDASRLVEKAPIVVSKDPKIEGRYELIGANRTVPVLMQDGFAFIPFGNTGPEVLDREFPDPAALVQSQVNQFDISVKLDIASIPVGTRSLLTNVITSGMSAQMQQRDDEPESVYQMRKAWSERDMQAFKQLLDECRALTLGIDVNSEDRSVNIDMVVDTPEGSQMMRDIIAGSSKPSYFIPLLNEDAPVSISMSSMLTEIDKERYADFLEAFKDEIVRQIDLNNFGPVPDRDGVIGQAINALQETAKEGHMDVFLQCFQDPSDKLAVVGAMRLKEGELIASGLQDIAVRFADQDIEIGELQTGFAEHQGVTFHRIDLNASGPEISEVFGDDLGIIIGVGARTGWMAFGGNDAFASLKTVMDQLVEATASSQERAVPPSLQLVVNMNRLIDLQQKAESAGREARETEEVVSIATELSQAGNENEQSQRAQRIARRRQRQEEGGRIFRETMAEGDDRIIMSFRPTETGGRMRIRLEEGFVKVFGRLIAARLTGDDS